MCRSPLELMQMSPDISLLFRIIETIESVGERAQACSEIYGKSVMWK